jgi:hypothetical protein
MKKTDANTEHSNSYTLNREYFSECFDQTANTTTLKTYRQAILFIVAASILFVMNIEAYIAWFLACIGGVELLSIRFKRSWWITRQMLSRAAGNVVTIRLDDQGIYTDSAHHQQAILWNDITEIKPTEKGFVITHTGGSSYLSKQVLDEDALVLLATKSTLANLNTNRETEHE